MAIPGHIHHEDSIPDDFAKMQPQHVNEGFKTYDLAFLTYDGLAVLGDAVEYIILWHKKDIIWTSIDAPPKPPTPPQKKSVPHEVEKDSKEHEVAPCDAHVEMSDLQVNKQIAKGKQLYQP
uniref:DUF8039 domain-containing protein n=1 Tax=Oryza meridionalis TaxID=40149 RepID=A0A0E0C2M0_9ORYZ